MRLTEDLKQNCNGLFDAVADIDFLHPMGDVPRGVGGKSLMKGMVMWYIKNCISPISVYPYPY